jgi:hypothetical protein
MEETLELCVESNEVAARLWFEALLLGAREKRGPSLPGSVEPDGNPSTPMSTGAWRLLSPVWIGSICQNGCGRRGQ